MATTDRDPFVRIADTATGQRIGPFFIYDYPDEHGYLCSSPSSPDKFQVSDDQQKLDHVAFALAQSRARMKARGLIP